MAVSCVILNYNDWKTTKKLVEKIRGYKTLDYIVLVDNASSDDSCEELEKLKSDKLFLIRNRENRGYGAGNNTGIRYSREVLGCEYVLIANPDVEFEEDTVRALTEGFSLADDSAVVSCVMKNAGGEPQISGWKVYGLLDNLLSTEPLCIRLFRYRLHYPSAYFEGKDYCLVEAVPGSLLMVDAEKMADCGMYDEHMFLYEEERTLGFKLKEKKYKTVLLLNYSYLHLHSVTIKKNVKSAAARQRILHKSKLYYYRRYLHIGPVKEMLAKIWLGFVMLEVKIASGIFKISW